MSERAGCRTPGTLWDGYPLRSARLRLRPAETADLDALVPLLDDPEVSRFTARIPSPCRRADLDSFLAGAEANRRARRGAALVLERISDGTPIGGLSFDPGPDGQPDLGCWIARAEWGRGYATEAVRRLLRALFQDLGFARVTAWAHRDNLASQRALARLGLRDQGEAVQPMPAHGGTAPVRRFALDRATWAAAHAARPQLLVAAAALVDGDGRVLMTTRPPGKSMAGLWEFPGGKVAPGETPEQALVRELEEELGIDATESCLAPLAFASHDYDSFHLLMPLYVLRVWRGSPQPREGQSLRWVRAARLGDLPMPPADIPLVALLREWV